MREQEWWSCPGTQGVQALPCCMPAWALMRAQFDHSNTDPKSPLRIFLYRGFLTYEECDEMIKKSESRLRRSGVSDSITGAVGAAEERSLSWHGVL